MNEGKKRNGSWHLIENFIFHYQKVNYCETLRYRGTETFR